MALRGAIRRGTLIFSAVVVVFLVLAPALVGLALSSASQHP
jgi:hypothetical protein